MKTLFILLSVIALVISSPVEETNDIKDYIEIIKCFLDQQPLIDDVNAIVEMIKTQDFSQAITLLFKAYGDVQSAISQCIPKQELNGIPACCFFCGNEKKVKIMIYNNQEEKDPTWEQIEEMYEQCIDSCPSKCE